MTRRIALVLALVLAVLVGGQRSEAQKSRVTFRGVVKGIETPLTTPHFTKYILVKIASVEGQGYLSTVALREADARLFGYGDEVDVEISVTGRKVQ